MIAHSTPTPKTGWCWHVHHDDLLEWCSDYDGRVAYIQNQKPPVELALRLRLFRPVRGPLPAALYKARAAYDKAGAAYDKAGAAHDKARAAYDKAGAAHDKAGAAHDKARAARDKADAAYDKARAAYDKAGAALYKTRAAYDKARAAYDKAGAALYKTRSAMTSDPVVLALHARECPDCPWNGHTIFPNLA